MQRTLVLIALACPLFIFNNASAQSPYRSDVSRASYYDTRDFYPRNYSPRDYAYERVARDYAADRAARDYAADRVARDYASVRPRLYPDARARAIATAKYGRTPFRPIGGVESCGPSGCSRGGQYDRPYREPTSYGRDPYRYGFEDERRAYENPKFYAGRDVLGQPEFYGKSQPVRNFFRFITP